MNLNRHLDASDWMLLGYLLGLAALWVLSPPTSSTTDSRSISDQKFALTEDHMQRLESGESVVIPRWHGHDLILDGTVFVHSVEGDSDG